MTAKKGFPPLPIDLSLAHVDQHSADLKIYCSDDFFICRMTSFRATRSTVFISEVPPVTTMRPSVFVEVVNKITHRSYSTEGSSLMFS